MGPVAIGDRTNFPESLFTGTWRFSGAARPLLGMAGASPLFADQTTPYYLVEVLVQNTVGNGFNLFFARSAAEGIVSAGPEFADAWEDNGAGAYTIGLAGVEYAFSGPNAPGSVMPDTTEPYQSFVPPPADHATAGDLIAAINAASQADRDAMTISFCMPVQSMTLTATDVTVGPGETEFSTLTAAGGIGPYTYEVIGGPSWATIEDEENPSVQMAPPTGTTEQAYAVFARATDTLGNYRDVEIEVTVGTAVVTTTAAPTTTPVPTTTAARQPRHRPQPRHLPRPRHLRPPHHHLRPRRPCRRSDSRRPPETDRLRLPGIW